jgi:hypothetical protein
LPQGLYDCDVRVLWTRSGAPHNVNNALIWGKAHVKSSPLYTIVRCKVVVELEADPLQ